MCSKEENEILLFVQTTEKQATNNLTLTQRETTICTQFLKGQEPDYRTQRANKLKVYCASWASCRP